MHPLMLDGKFPSFYAFPKFLLGLPLTDAAMLVYTLLLDRARSSMCTPGWVNAKGQVFVIYTVEQLATELRRSPRSISTALAALERAGLIHRKRHKVGTANHIFFNLPDEENCMCQMQKTASAACRKLPTNKKENNQNIEKEWKKIYDYQEDDSL